MMLKVLISVCVGAMLGFIVAYKMFVNPANSPIPTHNASEINYTQQLEELNQKIALQQFENELLLNMVKSGITGDIKEHINTFQKLSQSESSSKVQTLSNSQQSAFTNPKKPIVQIHKADIALQKQALSEGWANDETFAIERQNLWETARNNLSEQAYMAGLYDAKLPNVLYVESVDLSLKNEIKRGDVLTHIAQERVFNRYDLRRMLKKLSDAQLELTFNRKGYTYTTEVNNVDKNIDFTGYSIKHFN